MSLIRRVADEEGRTSIRAFKVKDSTFVEMKNLAMHANAKDNLSHVVEEAIAYIAANDPDYGKWKREHADQLFTLAQKAKARGKKAATTEPKTSDGSEPRQKPHLAAAR